MITYSQCVLRQSNLLNLQLHVFSSKTFVIALQATKRVAIKDLTVVKYINMITRKGTSSGNKGSRIKQS